jgi:ABC-type multidrug transport system fused ATPase/permease subunit
MGGTVLVKNQTLLSYAKKEAKLYTLSFVGSLFRFLIPLFVPLIMRYILDDLLQNSGLSTSQKLHQLFLIAAVVLAIFILIRMPMEYVRQYFMHTANNNMLKALRKDIFRKIHQLDAKYFADHRSGEIGTRFFDDIEKVRGLLTAAFSNVWIETTVLVFVISVMLTMNTELTALATGLVAFQFILAHMLSKRFKKSTKNMMNYRSVLNGFIFEKIQGAYLAKLFASQARDQEELDEHLAHYEVLTDKQAKLNAIMLSGVNVLSDMTPFVVVLVGSVFVVHGGVTLGSLVAFFAYVDKLRSPVAALVQAFPAITEGYVALQRIFDFLRIPQEIQEQQDPVQLQQFSKGITFQNVTFAYTDQNPVIRNLSFSIEKGKTYAFVGESGGGKSTIVQLLLRMYDVQEGKVLIDGINIKDYALASLREHMGVVTQDTFLYSSSIKDNIRIAKLDATDEEIVTAAKKAFAHDFICHLADGYDTEIGERGIKLSGGQRQRIALARVFLKNPSLIILDEATSALDNESEKWVQESINRFDKDKTVIMIAHRLSTIVNADTIFVLKQGRIVESGTHETLLKANGYYKELYSKQQPATVPEIALPTQIFA